GRKWLPPMTALVSFEAAARHESFSRAGDEIGLTQSAVSRQIALLEDLIQVPLFDRIGRRVRLNEAGHAYAAQLAPALDGIRRATRGVAQRRAGSALRIATLPSFGMRWLAPRLPHLSARHPQLVVDFAARESGLVPQGAIAGTVLVIAIALVIRIPSRRYGARGYQISADRLRVVRGGSYKSTPAELRVEHGPAQREQRRARRLRPFDRADARPQDGHDVWRLVHIIVLYLFLFFPGCDRVKGAETNRLSYSSCDYRHERTQSAPISLQPP
ncbi:LysR family transcriptional regulator, partial [Rhizorhabdus sp.]|uniref:LysR family transcriptional regulator n=1 Tax=Rhizorhabdus sp. TaxID=1968843 RepID=UPI00199F2275